MTSWQSVPTSSRRYYQTKPNSQQNFCWTRLTDFLTLCYECLARRGARHHQRRPRRRWRSGLESKRLPLMTRLGSKLTRSKTTICLESSDRFDREHLLWSRFNLEVARYSISDVVKKSSKLWDSALLNVLITWKIATLPNKSIIF